jgi:hypothetical protein
VGVNKPLDQESGTDKTILFLLTLVLMMLKYHPLFLKMVFMTLIGYISRDKLTGFLLEGSNMCVDRVHSERIHTYSYYPPISTSSLNSFDILFLNTYALSFYR